jgi:hypothetical protein
MDMLYCSFCGKSQHKVRKLIAGPGVHICNECIDLCHEIAHTAPGTRPRLPPLPNDPGSFGCHEAMHLANVFGEIVHRYLVEHPAIRRNPDWATAVTKAATALHDVYQAIGGQHLEAEPAVHERGIVVGFAEASEHTQAAEWAETAATPDKDVGSVFTPLSPGLTGLPVKISVGDDAPLVIAAPQALTADEIAAVRHWVVRHQAALTAQWRHEIDSGELMERLRDERA